MRKKLFFIIPFIFFFLGCSTKINPNEYGSVNAPVSQYKPSEYEIKSKYKVLIVPFESRQYRSVADVATSTLTTVLGSYPPVIVKSRRANSIKDEIKLAEQAQISHTDLGEANYIIKGRIDSATTKSRYHKEHRWRDRKGKIHVIPAYYENIGCVNGEMEIIKIPENNIAATLSLNSCARSDTRYRLRDFRELLYSAVKHAVYSKRNFLYNFFAKKGYVYEVRKKDDETILHTTLGANDGAKEGLRVNIYTVKLIKMPFSDSVKKESVKIGEGEISNVVNAEDSWVIVNEVSQPVKIGDYVKPVHESGFSFRNIFR